ncbi:NAD(P)-dependent oxidoreductase [Anaerotignum propionicum]|uniref:NAD(P)-dependent oxidoreductase n=1 Tax=Anaerotignum propionicum TaxID=28446 RepID=UPI00289ED3BB|nr:NAD(P)-binding domain-containing protein [Anaerotignum propionicum]
MKKLGFIGMGIMGLPMATNILKKSGRPVIGFDVMEASREKFAEAGGIATGDAKAVYENCEIIFLCLPKNELVESVVSDIIVQGKKGTIIVDFSSTFPGVIRQLYPKLKAAGMSLIDSPVSGGETGAIAGTLVVMCGGDKEVFEEVKDLIGFVGSRVTYMGSSGCGDVAKLANNMIVGCNLIAVSEAFAFAVKAGLDPEVLFHAIKDGFAQNAVMDLKVPKIISRDFSASARIAVHQKDMKNAAKLAEDMGVEIPMSALVLNYMNRMDEAGLINEDQCALVKMFEQDMGIEVK